MKLPGEHVVQKPQIQKLILFKTFPIMTQSGYFLWNTTEHDGYPNRVGKSELWMVVIEQLQKFETVSQQPRLFFPKPNMINTE